MTTRGFNANYASLYKQMNILNQYDEVYLVHKYKTDKIVEYIEKTAKIKIAGTINLQSKFQEILDKKYEKWEDFYNSFSIEGEFDAIWLFGAPLSDGARLKRSYADTYNKVFTTKSYMNFVSIASLFFDMYSLVKIANDRNLEINELCYDPGEASLSFFEKSPNVKMYHGYDMPFYDMKRLDSLQQGLKNTETKNLFDDNEKIYDIVFGYSYMNEERKYVHEGIQKMWGGIDPNFNKKLYLKSKMTDTYNDIKYDDYLAELKKSRFTLIVPAYDKLSFSCYRFIEAIHNDCLPIVLSITSYREFMWSYNIDDEVFHKHLLKSIKSYSSSSENLKLMLDCFAVQHETLNNILGMNEEDRINIIDYYKKKLNLQ